MQRLSPPWARPGLASRHPFSTPRSPLASGRSGRGRYARRGDVLLLLWLGACAQVAPPAETGRHIEAPPPPPPGRPEPVPPPVFLPPPVPQPRLDTYSVVVSEVPVREMLFALARDARLDVDVHPLVRGTVTLNALNQTLPQILDRVARQADLRYSLDHGVLSVVPDRPYVASYAVDYINVSRSAHGKVTISTSVAASGGSVGSTGAGQAQNSSGTEIGNTAENRFWERLEKNLRELLASTRRVSAQQRRDSESLEARNEQSRNAEQAERRQDEARQRQEDRLRAAQAVAHAGAGAAQLMAMVMPPAPAQPNPAGGDADAAADVFVHPETGVVAVNATAREHARIRDYLARVAAGARRQVLIEATIVEVALGDQYQAGIDWRVFKDGDNRLNYGQSLNGNRFADTPLALLTYANPTSSLFRGADFIATIKLLEQFGKTRVLSSPKLMALNNQTALLKVVDEKVYFKLKVSPATLNGDGNVTSPATFETSVNTVPVGVVMSVTPQISGDGSISLNVRPTITRITGYATDPAPTLMGSPVDNRIPEIQVREMESTLTLADGQVAILGGLIQDSLQTSRAGWPGLSRLPWGLGDLFSHRDDQVGKTELVVFLRPVVVRNPSLLGDLAAYRERLPDEHSPDARADALSAFAAGLPQGEQP